MHDHVGVKYDETTKHEGATDGQHKLQCLAPEEDLCCKGVVPKKKVLTTKFRLGLYNHSLSQFTVGPLNKGPVGTKHFVPCREIVLSLEDKVY